MARKFCKHYRAMSENTTCKLGVSYGQFKGKSDLCPCFRQQSTQPLPCELAEYLTPEEAAAEDKWLQERFANMSKARQAIVDELGGPWKRGVLGGSGAIDCPVCGTGALRFSRSGYNGHIHAACTTETCVRWME